jgi:hypothetical protein
LSRQIRQPWETDDFTSAREEAAFIEEIGRVVGYAD